MHAIMLTGQFLIGLFFVFMAVYNFLNRTHMIENMKVRHIHIPVWALGLLVLLEGLGGLIVMFNYFQKVGAIYLILFTLVTSYVLHPFWTARGKDLWKHLWVVMGNLAVIGGLLLLLSMNS